MLLEADGRARYANRAARRALGGSVRSIAETLGDGPLPTEIEADGTAYALRWHPHDNGGRLGLLHERGPDADGETGARDRLLAEARTDPLTGLPNRASFDEALAHALVECGDLGADVGLLLIDLDEFKPVNDTLGHAVGDALLKAVAKRLQSAVREGDGVFRLGGDEFAVLVPCADPGRGGAVDTADAIARRAVDLVSRAFLVEGQMVHVGASVGIAVSEGTRDGTVLSKRADVALYRAKHEGRGRHVHFAPGMDDAMRERRQLEIEMRRGLALQEFELVYQPQFDFDSATVTGFEALIRWRHPSRGLIGPGAFIELAEDTRLIVPMGEWVLRAACRAAAEWTHPVSVSVNVSPAQFAAGGLVETVRSALYRAGLPASRLVVEITESLLLRDDRGTLDTLHDLRALGVRIAMDDFGTGTSSLSYLRTFPFDIVKVDQSFVRGEGDQDRLAAIVRAVASLGDQMGMRVTAEGVETMDQLEAVMRDGCGAVQGYLIGRPMPEGDVAAFFRDASDAFSDEPRAAVAYPSGGTPTTDGAAPEKDAADRQEPENETGSRIAVDAPAIVMPEPDAPAIQAPITEAPTEQAERSPIEAEAAPKARRKSQRKARNETEAKPLSGKRKAATPKAATRKRKTATTDVPNTSASPVARPLYRLVYQSLCALHDTEASLLAEVEDILAASRRNNERRGVSGALMFNGTHYAQVLEGTREAVEATFETIQLDPRHADVMLLSFEPVDARLFAHWSMAHVAPSGGRMAELAAITGFDAAALDGDAMARRLHDLLVEDASVAA